MKYQVKITFESNKLTPYLAAVGLSEAIANGETTVYEVMSETGDCFTIDISNEQIVDKPRKAILSDQQIEVMVQAWKNAYSEDMVKEYPGFFELLGIKPKPVYSSMTPRKKQQVQAVRLTDEPKGLVFQDTFLHVNDVIGELDKNDMPTGRIFRVESSGRFGTREGIVYFEGYEQFKVGDKFAFSYATFPKS